MKEDLEYQAQELVSALVDGELEAAGFARAMDALQSDPQARACWRDYQFVGEVLRHGSVAATGAGDEAFVARLRDRLGQAKPSVTAREVLVPEPTPESANDSVWRWKLVAGLSSLMAVAVLGWQLVMLRPDAPAPQLATVTAPSATTPPAVDAPVMIRDPRLDQLIAAHQQQGGTSALQMPAGFLRNATFERPAR